MESLAQSERLFLRRVNQSDFDFLLELFGDPKVMRFYPGVRDREGTRAWIENTIRNYEKDGHGKWLVSNRLTAEPMGHCGLIKMNVGGQDEAELGYFLARKHWGKGYATEAAKLAIKLGFEHFGYKRIVSVINPENARAVAVAKRLGMKFEKTDQILSNGNSFKSDVYFLEG